MKKLNLLLKAAPAGLLACVFTLVPGVAMAVPVQLQNGTATFSQVINGGPFTPDQAIDGDFGDNNGWTIATVDAFGGTKSETAVWETATDVSTTNLTFTMHFRHLNPGHLLGRFRFSITTDDRSTFADGLHTGGDVDANWVVLTNPIVSGPAGMSFTTLPDESILAGGVTASQGIYTVNYSTAVQSVTGIRLEALEDATLPGGAGPGLFPSNGNFFLTELTLAAEGSAPNLVLQRTWIKTRVDSVFLNHPERPEVFSPTEINCRDRRTCAVRVEVSSQFRRVNANVVQMQVEIEDAEGQSEGAVEPAESVDVEATGNLGFNFFRVRTFSWMKTGLKAGQHTVRVRFGVDVPGAPIDENEVGNRTLTMEVYTEQ